MELSKLYAQAQAEKNNIFNKYTRVAAHTMPYANFSGDPSSTSVNKKTDDIESVILQSSQDLNNLIMYSMLSGENWATASFDEELFYQIKETETVESIAKVEYSTLAKLLDRDSSKIFKLIFNSSYSSSVSKALNECINLGTGCIKLIEEESIIKPITFQFVSVNDLFITENYKNEPHNVFRNLSGVTKEDLEALFDLDGINADFGEGELNLIESCTQNKDGTYTHRLSDQSLNEHYFEYEIDHQIYLVFRWDTSHRNSYGIGIGHNLIDVFERLKKFKALYYDSAVNSVYPALMFTGNSQYLKKLSFAAGDVSYGGQAGEAQLQALNQNSSIAQVQQDIYNLENIIRDSYLSNPVGNYDTRKNVTKHEIKTRMDMFKERFSQTFNLLSDELLKATFVNVFKSLSARNLLEFPGEYVSLLQLEYQNELSQRDNYNNAQKLLEFKNISMTYFPALGEVATNDAYILNKYAELNNVDREAYKSQDELEEVEAAILDARTRDAEGGMLREGEGNTEAQGNTGEIL